MADMNDYLDWRGDVPFSVSPFNEVDNALLCKLTVCDFTGIVPEDGIIPIADAAREYFERNGEEEVKLGAFYSAGTTPLLAKLAESPRFRDALLCDYVLKIDPEREEQFSALTILLPGESRFVAFRGTDDTLVAWKEDLNMSYLDAVPAQKDAAEYLARAGRRSGTMRVGGHSKGGNLAVYSAMHAPEDVQERIVEVFNNDGPGFLNSAEGSEGYERISSRVRTLVPQHSMVGVLLNNCDDFEIVESCETGVSAHNSFTWQVRGTKFVRCEDFSVRSRIFRDAVRGWSDSLTMEQRRELTDAIFDALYATGAETLTDLSEQRLRKAAISAQELLSDPEERRLFAESVELLIKMTLSSTKAALPTPKRFKVRKK